MAQQTTLLAVGDIILDEPEADHFFDPSRQVTQAGDVVIGHVEVPHTDRGDPQPVRVPAPPSDPRNLDALAHAGFNAASMAANHLFDQGEPGVLDTMSKLHALGIATAGAGRNLAEARKPAIVERNGLRFGLLSFNCVGPEASWATDTKAGGAYVAVSGGDVAVPGTDFQNASCDPESLARMAADVESAKQGCEVLVVAFHKGVVHTPALVLDYEKLVAHTAIDAGADIVLGHHSHILRGIEVYKDRPVYHGLNNWVTVTRALAMDADDPRSREWARRRRELFSFEPDPDYPLYPFHPEAKQTILAKVVFDGGEMRSFGFLPCYVNRQYQPEVYGDDDKGRQVADYVRDISERAGLAASFSWQGDEVLVLAP